MLSPSGNAFIWKALQLHCVQSWLVFPLFLFSFQIPSAIFSPCTQLNLLLSLSSNIPHPKLRANFPTSAFSPHLIPSSQTSWSSFKSLVLPLGLCNPFLLSSLLLCIFQILLSLADINVCTKLCFGRLFALLKSKLTLTLEMTYVRQNGIRFLHSAQADPWFEERPSFLPTICHEPQVLPSVRVNQDCSGMTGIHPYR